MFHTNRITGHLLLLFLFFVCVKKKFQLETVDRIECRCMATTTQIVHCFVLHGVFTFDVQTTKSDVEINWKIKFILGFDLLCFSRCCVCHHFSASYTDRILDVCVLRRIQKIIGISLHFRDHLSVFPFVQITHSHSIMEKKKKTKNSESRN